MRTILATATAFNNKFALHTATVEADGTILIYDDVAKHFTSCHSIDDAEAKEIRSEFIVMLAELLLDMPADGWDSSDVELLRNLVSDETDFSGITHFYYGTYECSEEIAKERAINALEKIIAEETAKEND